MLDLTSELLCPKAYIYNTNGTTAESQINKIEKNNQDVTPEAGKSHIFCREPQIEATNSNPSVLLGSGLLLLFEVIG